MKVAGPYPEPPMKVAGPTPEPSIDDPSVLVELDVESVLKVLYEPPFPIILHKDPPKPDDPPLMVMGMIAAAKQVCHENLEYLDKLEEKYGSI
jgi:hypothetical protein